MSVPGTGPAKADDMLLLPSAWTYEVGLPTEAWIQGFWVDAVLVIGGTGADSVCSFSLWYGSKEPVSVAGCYASTFDGTDELEGPEYGSRYGTRPTCQDLGDLGECLRRCILD